MTLFWEPEALPFSGQIALRRPEFCNRIRERGGWRLSGDVAWGKLYSLLEVNRPHSPTLHLTVGEPNPGGYL